VGGNDNIKIDVRIVAATNRNLEDAVKKGTFREDLYYRLNVILLETPPLRTRVGDVEELALFFLKRYNEKYQRKLEGFTPEALDIIFSHRWPGNIRELEQAIERIVIVKGQGTIDASDLPTKIFQAAQNAMNGIGANSDVDFPRMFLSEKGVDLKAVVTAFENHLVDQALARTSGNKNRASMLLGLNRTTLVEKLRKRGMITPLKSQSEFRGPMSGSSE
jgi:transcriptional regulator with PAS, ATPase and Fis domain